MKDRPEDIAISKTGALPKNVLAVYDWYRKNRPELLPSIREFFKLDQEGSTSAQACVALILQGFEAGREFQREHPDVKSGIGYLS